MPMHIPDLQGHAQELEIRRHERDPHKTRETMRDLLGRITLTEHVPFTRPLDDADGERSMTRARD